MSHDSQLLLLLSLHGDTSYYSCCLTDDAEVVILYGAHAELHSNHYSVASIKTSTACHCHTYSSVIHIGKASTNILL